MPSFSRVMLAGALGAVLAVTAAAPASPAGTAGTAPPPAPPRGAGRRRAVPARPTSRGSARHDDRQQGVVDRPEGRRARRDLLPGPRHPGRPRAGVRRLGRRRAARAGDGSRVRVRTDLADGRSLTYRQSFTDAAPAAWRLTASVRDRPGPRRRAGRPAVHRRGPAVHASTRVLRPGAVQHPRRRRRPHRGPRARRDATASVGERARPPRRLRRHLERVPRAPATAGPTCSPTAASTGAYTSATAGNLVQTAATGAHRPARPRRTPRWPSASGPDAGARSVRRRGLAARAGSAAPRGRTRAAGTRTWPASRTCRRRCADRASGSSTGSRQWCWPPARTRRTAARTSRRRPCRGPSAGTTRPGRTTWSGRATSTRSPPR